MHPGTYTTCLKRKKSKQQHQQQYSFVYGIWILVRLFTVRVKIERMRIGFRWLWLPLNEKEREREWKVHSTWIYALQTHVFESSCRCQKRFFTWTNIRIYLEIDAHREQHKKKKRRSRGNRLNYMEHSPLKHIQFEFQNAMCFFFFVGHCHSHLCAYSIALHQCFSSSVYVVFRAVFFFFRSFRKSFEFAPMTVFRSVWLLCRFDCTCFGCQ